MLLLDRLQEILIFHRQLDYNDEDATLEEQGEKILYFFSTNLDARDVKDQLSVATLAEALIELTNKFSKEPVQTVVMHRKFWAFMECEPGIWMVFAFLNNSEAITSAKYNANNITSDQVMSVDVCRSFMVHFYSLYCTINGSIQSFINGPEGKGMATIDEIMITQRKIRKLRKKVSIKESDIKRFEEDKDAFIPESTESLEELNDQLTNLHAHLLEMLQNPQYTLPLLRMKISNYIQWYLYQENLNSISMFSSMRSLASKHHIPARKMKHCLSSVNRVITAVKSALPELSIQCILSFEHKLLWSDVSEDVTNHVLEFFYRCDHTIKLGNTNRRLRLATEEFTRSVFQESKCDYASFDPHYKEKFFLALREKELKVQGRYGAFLINGQTMNLETFTTVLSTLEANSSHLSNKDPSSSSVKSDMDESELLTRILQSDGFSFDERTILYHPKIYQFQSSSSTALKNRDCAAIGRLIHFSFGRLTLSIIFEENTAFQNYHAAMIQQLIEQPSSAVNRRVKVSWIYDQMSNKNNNNCLYPADPPDPTTTTNPVEEEDTTASSADQMTPVADPKDIRRIQLLLLCYLLQRAVRGELERIDMNDWNRYFLLYNHHSLSSTSTAAGTGTGAAAVIAPSLSTSSSSRSFQSISMNSNSNPNSPMVSQASISLSSASGNLFPSSSVSTGGGASIAISGSNNTSSDYLNRTTIRGLILPKPFPDREAKVFYFTKSFAGVKVYDRVGGGGETSIPSFLTPEIANDLRTILANTSSLTSLTSLSSISGTIPSNKILESLLDQYFYQQTVNSPFAAVFFQCLAYCFGLTAMKALMDLWRELEEEEKERDFPIILKKKKEKERFSARGKKFSLTRVSTLQRGGVWVVARRLIDGQGLYLLVNQCGNVSDVMEIVDQIMREIRSK